jgi:hypothetical protein
MFFLTVIIIWRYHEKSIRLEEDEDTLKPVISHSITNTTSRTTTTTTIYQEIDDNRLNYWLTNNSKTIGINLTAILAPKRSGKYLVYVCHENCGGNFIRQKNLYFVFFFSKVGEIVFEV